MIGTIIRAFWFPIVVIVVTTISFWRSARRLKALSAVDKGIGESPASANPRSQRPVGPRIVVGLCAFGFLIFIQYAPRFALVHAATTDYAVVAIIAAALVAARLRLLEALRFSARPPLTRLATWFGMAAAGVSAVLLTANALLDSGPVRDFPTVVTSAHCYRRSYELTVRGAPALPVEAESMRVNVNPNVCGKVRDGDTVIVGIGPGYLGRPWVQPARAVQVARR
jgi:hypothetical protein